MEPCITKKALIKCIQNIVKLFISGYFNRVLTTMIIHRLAIQESCSCLEALSQERQDRFQTRGDCYTEWQDHTLFEELHSGCEEEHKYRLV